MLDILFKIMLFRLLDVSPSVNLGFSIPVTKLVRLLLCPKVVSVESYSAVDTLAAVSLMCAPTDRDISGQGGDLKS